MMIAWVSQLWNKAGEGACSSQVGKKKSTGVVRWLNWIELNWKGSEEEEWASRNRTHPRSSFPTSLTVSPVHRLGVRPSFFLFIMFIYQLYMEGCCMRPALSPASIRESPRVFTPHRLILIILQKRTIFPPFSVQKSRGSFLSAEQSHLNLA